MVLHPFPDKIYIFDINGTLDLCSGNSDIVQAHQAFKFLREQNNVWVGVWSGMYHWMQLQEMTDAGVIPDFVLQKDEYYDFIESIERIYDKCFGGEVFCVGDEEEDIKYAKTYGAKYLTPNEFNEMMKARDTYQDLLLPDYLEKGFKDTNKTWENIKGDFSGKVVLDIGCNQGYFLVQCFIAGAKRGIGVDMNGTHWGTPIGDMKKPLDVAKQVFEKWGFDDVKLIEGDWEEIEIEEKVDVVICLSTLHYFKNLTKGLKKMFELKPELLIFEARPDTIPVLLEIKDEYGYRVVEELESHWNGYTIYKMKQ